MTVSREPSGKYFASLLFDCENQTAEKRQAEKNSWGWILPCMGCVYFLPVKEPDIPCFTGMQRKNLPGNRESFPDVKRAAVYQKQKKKVALYHEKIKNQRKDFQHKLSHGLAEDYDAVCVEDLKT